MRIAVVLDRARLFRWHLALADALKACGNEVLVRFRACSDPLPTSLTVVLDFDRARGHTSSDRFSMHMDPAAFAALKLADGAAVDMTLDLSTGVAIERQAGPVVRPLYDGSVRDYALFHALFERRAPHLTIWHSERMEVFDIGRPSLDDPLVLSTSFDQVTSRLVEGLVRLFSGGPRALRQIPRPPRSRTSGASEPILQSALGYGLARARRKLRRAADLFSGDGPRWYSAWRGIGNDELLKGGPARLATYRILEDDGNRTFADPCLFSHQGVVHCFVTEMPEATGIAAISYLPLETGGAGKARTVLAGEEGLRRPFIFVRDGAVWLLADRAGGGVDLYRAKRFPDEWAFEMRLIDDPLHAPTFFEHDGSAWICGTSQAFQSSENDGLVLYCADTLVGPWRAHSRNPVLVDGRSARPAGALWQQGEATYRPGQDHCDPHGGVHVKRILSLSADDYEEEESAGFAFPPRRGLSGPFTVTRGGGFEVIDFLARPSAVRAAFR